MTIRSALLLILALAASLAASRPASAERLVVSLSSHRVLVTSNFVGEQIVLFGTVERDSATVRRRGGYDLVVTVTGPRETLVTRRKERVLGIWVNVDSRTFVNVPSYLAVLANKPFDQIAAPDTLRRLQIGLENTLLPQQIGVDLADVVRDDPFRAAFLRLKSERSLYREEPNAVTFLTGNLFRATIPLPAGVPIGNYDVDIKLFADGAVIARTTSALEIIKSGFEQFVVTAARDHALSYGLATAAMAIMTGWFASIIFRRD
ncbi:MAG TPA: TIGR02186 family protein [Xanthobacteraceae bacterium]|nr:TIGR02186 family protein [Xanthobacteraceae bacterium]